MATPYPIRNGVLLHLEKSLIDEISTESGFKLYLAPEYNFEQNVTVQGKVSVLPKDFKGDLSVGDEVVFSYHVVSDRAFPNTSERFVEISAGGQYVKVWANGKGEKLRMMAHQGLVGLKWTGTYFDSRGLFQYGTEGTESQVERWMSQNFTFGDCENFIYKNLISINGEDYWKCSYENIFAKKVDGEIVSVGDRVICEIMEVPLDARQFEVNGIHLPDSTVSARLYDRGVVVSGGGKLGLNEGDVVSFDPQYCEKYELWGKQYFMVKERRAVGLWEVAA